MNDKSRSRKIIATYHELNPASADEWFSISNSCMEKLFAMTGETAEETVDLLSEREQTIVFIQLLIDEVENGGFDQWLYASTGDRADETLEALKRIGADKTHDLAARAISLFPGGSLPRDHEARIKLMLEVHEKHAEIADELYKLNRPFHRLNENIIDLAIAYWRRTEPQPAQNGTVGTEHTAEEKGSPKKSCQDPFPETGPDTVLTAFVPPTFSPPCNSGTGLNRDTERPPISLADPLQQPASGTAAARDVKRGKPFRAEFETTKGAFTVEVHPQWAPHGAARFRELIENGFYDGCVFFRVIEGFMAQTGINGDPKVQAKWRDANIKDDPVIQSNKRGFVTYAKTALPNSPIHSDFHQLR